ncbi:hypothetical protein C8R44DRAFT_862340 [Mycena epipterygia]|nr:hypothetical protein C8R44DRAFT_862340 [Mycena epipterygia]
MEKQSETWDTSSFASVFRISLEDRSSSSTTINHPVKANAGVQYTAICGFGWRFAFRIDTQAASSFLNNPIKSFAILFSFDPHLIASARYGEISIDTRAENLVPNQPNAPPVKYSLPGRGSDWDRRELGSYIYPSNGPAPVVTFTVVFPSGLGLMLRPSRSLEYQAERMFEESLAGKDLIDIKFYTFSRFTSGHATHPLALFARESLLQGFSDDLDNLLAGQGFSESAIVNLDLHSPEEAEFNEYGYDSDSDLDSDREEEEGEGEDSKSPGIVNSHSLKKLAPRSSSPSDAAESMTNIEKYLRRGRIIVLKDTAHKTWKALLYYLYTKRIKFSPLRSEGSKNFDAEGPICSAKSMYRLADKLGLDELKSSALEYIRSRLSEDNILHEVFSSFTSMYPTIQTLEVDYLTSRFSKKVSDGLDEMAKKICEGQKPHCAVTLAMIIRRKMGSK